MAKRKRYEEQMLLASGEQIPGHNTVYLVDRVIGMGSFGAVYFARDPDKPGRKVALKEFFPPRHPRELPNLKALFERERTVGMAASPHPLMPTFYEAMFVDQHYYIAQEYIEGTTLDEIIFKRSPLPREWTLKWAVSLCDAIAFLHSRQVIHHDLKPANIRISPQGHLTLLDFGAAQYFGKGYENSKPVEMYGTEGYLPPELEADGKWVADVRTDIFAMGCILFEMIAGSPPDQSQINERSMYVTSMLMQKPNADMELIKLINRALSYNTEFRFASANEFLMELRKIAPPVLLVNRKHLRFGEVEKGKPVSPMGVKLYNAGGGEVSGEIKPRAPWILVDSTSFDSNHRDVSVTVDPARITERNQVVTGRLEINTRDEMDMAGNVTRQGDRWFVECSATVTAIPGRLAVVSPAGGAALALSARKGQPGAAQAAIQNAGDGPIEFTAELSAANGGPAPFATVTPAQGALTPGQTTPITVQLSPQAAQQGSFDWTLTVKSGQNQKEDVPIKVVIEAPPSPVSFLKSLIGRR